MRLRTTARRSLPLLLGVPVALATTAVLAFQYRIQLSNRLQLLSRLPSAPTGRTGPIIVFAPHCDDESLATGGLIQTAKQAGRPVKVVVMTNGEGFPIAAGREFRKLRVKPGGYIRFAETRQNDTRRAAAALGLSRDDLIFLGYPDRGLSPMWIGHWSPDNPFRSPYTKLARSSYANSYRSEAAYCGRRLFEDIRSILVRYRPSDIYIPHPSDDHPDHRAAYAFVVAALSDLQMSEHPRLKTRVHTYLVHRGDWPEPWGWKPELPLRPPAAMARLDTKWDTLPLTDDMVLTKREAIQSHRTQVAVMGRFLNSFARKNEFFGRIGTPTVPTVSDGAMSVDGETDDWRGIGPGSLDPVADTVVRGIERAGDVRSVRLCADSSYVYVRVDFTRNLSKRVLYHVSIRSFGARGGRNTKLWAVSIRPPSRCRPAGVYFAWKERVLEIKAPRSDLARARTLFVSVDTSTMRIRVDRTGWREYELPDRDHPEPAHPRVKRV